MKKRKLIQNVTNAHVNAYTLNYAYTLSYAHAYAYVRAATVRTIAHAYTYARADSVLGKSIAKELFHCAWMYLKKGLHD